MSCFLNFAADPVQATDLKNRGLVPLGETGYWAEPQLIRHEVALLQTVKAFERLPSPLSFDTAWLQEKKTDIIQSKKHKVDSVELGEQLNAVFEMFSRSTRLSVVTGPPGAAKSTVTSLWIQVALAQYPAMPVIIMAQEKTALNRLYDKVNFPGACAWTIDQAIQRDWPREAAILIDEAGLLCTETLSVLLERAYRSDAVKVILIGDDKQLTSHAPGQPFRWLCQQDFIDRITLDVSFRQKNTALRQAVAELYQGRIVAALEHLDCHFLQPDDMLPIIRDLLEQTTPEKAFIIVHGPALIAEQLQLLCSGFHVLTLAAAQGLAVDKVIFILAEPIHLGEMLVGCSRQRFELDILIDASIYADKQQFADTIGPYPETVMALDIADSDTLLNIIDQA